MIFCHEEQDVPVCTWLLFLDLLFCILLNQERGRTKRVGCMLVISSLWPLLKFFSGVPPMIANSDGDTFLLQTRVFKCLFPWHPLLFAFISFCGHSVCTGSLHPMGLNSEHEACFLFSIWRCDKTGDAKPPQWTWALWVSMWCSAGTHMVLLSRTKEVYAAYTPDPTMEISNLNPLPCRRRAKRLQVAWIHPLAS